MESGEIDNNDDIIKRRVDKKKIDKRNVDNLSSWLS